MTVRILTGDAREVLKTLPAGSVHCVVTSPPYWGLRDYGTPPVVWERQHGASLCTCKRKDFCTSWCGTDHEHDWQPIVKPAANGIVNSAMQGETMNGASGTRKPTTSGRCSCGAWLGSLGLEPTPELYIEHLVEVFRHVWRVLRDDGVLFLNLGDAYAGSGKGPSNSLNKGNLHSHEAAKTHRGLNRLNDTPTQWIPLKDKQQTNRGSSKYALLNDGKPAMGYKPKDLMMLPARVALALQADGWWIRAQLPWLKRNCMPGSEKDRPTTAVEYVYLLSKRRRYWWDYDAAKKPSSGRVDRWPGSQGRIGKQGWKAEPLEKPDGRNWRNSDLFFESWQGLLLDEQDDPLALIVNPAPYKGAHYATFPPKLVEPMVKAACPEGGTVLDPFGGSGTVGMVADRLNRNAVLCELSDDYGHQAVDRVAGDAPMFTEVEVA